MKKRTKLLLKGGGGGLLAFISVGFALLAFLALSESGFGDSIPGVVLSFFFFISMLSGFFFTVMIAGFGIPHGIGCPKVVERCLGWHSEKATDLIEKYPDAVPWVMEGQAGVCRNISMQPLSDCAQRAQMIGGLLAFVLLLLIYIAAGIIVARLLDKRKKK